MCGIVAIFNIKGQKKEQRDKALAMAKRIRHRGPDWSGIYCGESAVLAHERLSIVDPQSGRQPLFSPDGKQILAVNGEIYNHRDIRKRYSGQYPFQTGSDCEVILALYRDKGIRFLEDLNGIFAFALYDEANGEFLIARDPIGVIPLYIGYDSDGKVYCASELKALEGFCERYEPFLPGHYYWSREGIMKRWYRRKWMDEVPHTEAGDSLSGPSEQQTAGIPGGVVGPRRIRVGGLGLEFVDDASFKHDIHPVHVQQPRQGERKVSAGDHGVGVLPDIAHTAVEPPDIQEVSEVVCGAYSLKGVVDTEFAVLVGPEQQPAAELLVETADPDVPAVGCESYIEVVGQEILSGESPAEVAGESGKIAFELDSGGEAAFGIVELEVVVGAEAAFGCCRSRGGVVEVVGGVGLEAGGEAASVVRTGMERG